MKIRIFPRDDGTTLLVIDKTRPWEIHGVSRRISADEDLEAVLDEAIAVADGEGKQAWLDRRRRQP